MIGNTTEDLTYAVIELLPDGSIVNADETAQRLFKFVEREEACHLLSITNDVKLQGRFNECLNGDAKQFVERVGESEYFFLFQPIYEARHHVKSLLFVMEPYQAQGREEANHKQWNGDLLSSIGEMSAGIAHEVRNPLTSVSGFLQLLQTNYEKEYVNIAQEELERALHILNDLLTISRPDVYQEDFSTINICSELDSLLLLFQNQLYDIEVIKQFESKHCEIIGKQNQIKKALFNLMKNAIEAMPDGGTLSVIQHEDVDGIHVKIRDTGSGIPEEKLSLLGTPFFSTKKDGTGMGLAQVYAAINENGGSINVSSKEGEGALFHLIFPKKQVVVEEKLMRRGTMENKFAVDEGLIDFIIQNAETFGKDWLSYIKRTKSYIMEFYDEDEPVVKRFNELFTLIARSLNNPNKDEIMRWTKGVGTTRAKMDFPINLSWEIFQASREILWTAINQYYDEPHHELDRHNFFQLERRVNNTIDMIINFFTSYYVKYKNDLLQSQREAVDEMSVPVIPLTDAVSILPIVGNVDTYRAKKLREKTLVSVKELKAKKLIIDISGVPYVDTAVVNHLFKIVKGLKLLGCRTILTGISAEIADTMIELGIDIDDEMDTKSDLQQALQDIKMVNIQDHN